MPPRNRQKQYLENSYYHIYNRGNNKQLIFLDEQDYAVFLSYLKEYLLPKDTETFYKRLADPNTSYKDKNKILKLLKLKNFAGEITLIVYCLMPNHFHLFIKQKGAQSVNKFMSSLCTRYTAYFHHKYKRTGHLYQDAYKGVLVLTEPQFIYLSKYIHKQALASPGQSLQGWEGQPSSYEDYLGKRKTEWVHPEEVLGFFAKANPAKDYQVFVEEKELGPIENILLEE